MKKITELTAVYYRTVREKDSSGNWVSRRVNYTALRPVQSQDIWLRLVHHIIDAIFMQICIILICVLIGLLIYSTGSPVAMVLGIIFMYAFAFASMPLYYALTEYFFQATLGKKIMGSIVIDEYANKPTFGNCVLRTLIRAIPFEFISFFMDGKGWHDTWTNTFVVSKKEYETLKQLLAEAEQKRV